jgi:hypothetical protein
MTSFLGGKQEPASSRAVFWTLLEINIGALTGPVLP